MIVNKIGKLGEDLAALFLKRKGYLILFRNYWKPYGEIDIVCQKQNKLYFIEVKSVSREIASNANNKVTRENHGDRIVIRLPDMSGRQSRQTGENFSPEQNIHENKLRRLGRVVQVFLSENNFQNSDWQFDVCVVEIDEKNKKSRIKLIENQLIPDFKP